MRRIDPNGVRDLAAPVLIVAFDGWVSAGAAGTATADHLAGESPVVVEYDADLIFDYRVSRPTADFDDGVLGAITWPQLAVRRRRGDPDLLILSGPEPNWHWQLLGSDVADLAQELGVTRQISLGGIPWAAPHTRPTVVTTTASRPELLGDEPNAMGGPLRVPAAAALIIERAVADRGIDTIGLWARVPHYVGGTYYPAVVTLTERVARHTGLTLDLDDLVGEAAEQRRQLDETMAGQAQVQALVERYEQLYDAGEELASGEEIAAEFERFLRRQTEENGGRAGP